MGKRLKSAPVFFTVLQVRFNPILRLDEYLPVVQDRLRRVGYPAFSPRQTFALNLVVNAGQQQPAPQPTVEKHYLFGSLDQRHAFVLTNSALTLQSTAYGDFETFSRKFLEGLEVVHDAVKLDYTDRIGLRYLDHIFPKTGDALGKYLAAEMLGLHGLLGGKLVHSFTEAACVIDKVTLRSRAVIQDGPVAFPPDISWDGMAVESRFLSAVGLHSIMDTDGFTSHREVFELQAVSKNIGDIHEAVRKAFHSATTDYARSVWDE